MINDEDQKWFDDACKDSIVKMKNDSAEESGTVTSWEDIVPGGGSLLFSDLMSAEGKYEYIPDKNALQKSVEDFLDNYNEENSKAPMNLVMFLDAVGHVCRLVRILRQPQGNVLCLGVGGSGRQSLTRLATFIREYDVYQVEIKKGNVQNWNNENVVKLCSLY